MLGLECVAVCCADDPLRVKRSYAASYIILSLPLQSNQQCLHCNSKASSMCTCECSAKLCATPRFDVTGKHRDISSMVVSVLKHATHAFDILLFDILLIFIIITHPDLPRPQRGQLHDATCDFGRSHRCETSTFEPCCVRQHNVDRYERPSIDVPAA